MEKGKRRKMCQCFVSGSISTFGLEGYPVTMAVDRKKRILHPSFGAHIIKATLNTSEEHTREER